jgi:hypothetical protein
MNEWFPSPARQTIRGNLLPLRNSVIQRKCDCGEHSMGGECDECKKKHSTLQRSAVGTATQSAVPPVVHEVLRSQGQPLERNTRGFMESRLGQDFSRVRVHSDAQAGESARAVGALAYTVGHDLVFAPQQFAPKTASGRLLLAHELAHTVQQEHPRPQSQTLQISDSTQHEREADLAARVATAGQILSAPSLTSAVGLARFSDTGHHVIEEAGLSDAGFSSDQIKAIEKGNIQRDYSQIGAVGNFLLLCDPKGFGGYKAEEHFDNFIFDAVTNRWRTRGTAKPFLHDDPNTPDRSPIDYIESELMILAKAGLSDHSLVHLGNAFHTVEDFFAHSNFVELSNKDLSFGKDLVTGSFEGESANSDASLAHTLRAISDPKMRPHYDQQAEAATARTEPRSHSRIAKDTPGTRNYDQARRLAALVIQSLGGDVRASLMPGDAQQREQMMAGTVAKIRRYLQPPNPNDRWWENLVANDKGRIDQRLDEAAAHTPVTANQCVFSPLRNIEASASSSWKLPIGVAIPVRVGTNQIWLQGGLGVTSPLPLDRSVLDAPAATGEKSQLIGGVQLTGTF